MGPVTDPGVVAEESAAAHRDPRPDCRICGAQAEGPVHRARERMFDTGEVFRYSECTDCGTLQLLDVPGDFSPYYPPAYYSMAPPPRIDGLAERAAKALRSLFVLRAPAFLLRVLPDSVVPGWMPWFRGAIRSLRAPIVDFGSGRGRLLTYLYNDGFRSLAGYDPFLPDGSDTGPVPLYRDVPPGFAGSNELVMLHHSLEHTTDPVGVLREAASLLSPAGSLLVRIPLADSFAWKQYGTDWISLDPPRHVFLLTERSLAHIAADAGLRVDRSWRDASSFQFWGSEQVRRGVCLEDECSLWKNPESSLFTKSELAEFDRLTARLNASGEGDCGGFILGRL